MTPHRRGARAGSWLAAALVFGVALAVRLFFVMHAVVTPFDGGDAGQYLAYALNLVHHGVFSVAVGDMPVVPDAWRTPGYPAFLAVFLAAWGEDAYMPVLLAQAVLGAVTVLLGSLLAGRVAGRGMAVAVGLLGAFWPHLVTSCAYLLSEALYAALVMGTIAVFATIGPARATGRAALAGALAGLAWLTNPVCAAAWVAIAAFTAWRGARRVAIVFLLVFAIAPAAWSLRGAIAVPPGAAAPAGRAWVNFVQGSHPEYHVVHRQRLAHAMTPAAVQAWDDIDAEIALGGRSPIAGLRRVAARLAATPLQSLRWYAIDKPVELWGWDIAVGQGAYYVYPTYRSPYETSPAWRGIAALCFGLNPLVAIAALLGVLAAGWRLVSQRRGNVNDNDNDAAARVAIVATLLVATLVHGALQAEPRYAVPYRMLELAAAAMAGSAAFRWLRARRQAAREIAP